MIKKLKKKFIILSMSAILVLLILMVSGMNLLNYRSMVNDVDSVISILSQNKGGFPFDKGNTEMNLPKNMSPETPYESRYFSVLIDRTGNIMDIDLTNISSVDSEKASEYVEYVLKKDLGRGFCDRFRYITSYDPSGYRLIFLDCGRKFDSFYNFMEASILMALFGYAIVFLVLMLLSNRIIKPISESYDKQRQFITDAGHEIKTPLTIINANLDLLKMEYGENDSLDDIEKQTLKLKDLTNELVMLSRMEEPNNVIEKIDFPLSEVVEEASSSFIKLAENNGKELKCDIQSMLSLNGNSKSIKELVSILLDNAIKYSKEDSDISLELKKENKNIELIVSNETPFLVDKEKLQYVFNRFYRTDESRNSETGGYGIGLSIAKAITESHNGKIEASTISGYDFTIKVIFKEG